MGKIAVLFAGQGAQFPGMGKDLYEKMSLCENIFEMATGLKRVAIGRFRLPDDLKPGEWRDLTDAELATLRTELC